MKKSKKSRVSWPSDSMLCQVKMFLKEDCPAKVSSQSSTKPKALNLPPGFEATLYPTTRPNISLRPQIKWKCPPKFILKADVIHVNGEESTEILTEHSRIAKVMEAFYPHRSTIPSSPSVSPSVQEERYDDTKTPNISPINIDDECDPALQPAASSELGLDLSLVDPKRLAKIPSDPNIVMSLRNGTTGKPPETANISQPRFVPQHVTCSPMDSNPISFPETRTQPGHALPFIPSCVATHPPLHKPTQLVSNALPLNFNLQKPPLGYQAYPLPRLGDSYTTVDDVVFSQVSKPQSHLTFSTGNMNREPESVKTGTDPQIRNVGYTMNINRDAREVSAKDIEYYKSLIRKHGVAAPATNETDNNMKQVKVKIQKPCMYFGRGRGCKNGENCLYLHDRSKRVRTNVAPEFPRAKRHKFGPS